MTRLDPPRRPSPVRARSPLLLGWLMVSALALLAAPARAADLTFLELHHVLAEDVIQFLRDTPSLAPLVEKGQVRALPGKARSLVIELDAKARDGLISTIRAFEYLEIRDRIEMKPVRIQYADIQLVLETLAASGICQVWHRTEETETHSQKHGNKTITHSYKNWVYQRYKAAAGDVALTASAPAIPYVIEIPHVDPVDIPPINLGSGGQSTFTLDFPATPSTEERNRVLIVGTSKDIERVRSYIEKIDRPARQIMIECQIIELDAESLDDLGIDLLSGAKRHNSLSFSSPLPGDPLPQPSEKFPSITQAGLAFLFDDQMLEQSGKFLVGLHSLIRNGEALIKARPKLYTLDDRQNILHIGEEVPTFESTAVNRDVTGGVFVEQVSSVTKQYVGITLNIRPRISGPEANEVSMLVDIQVNNLVGRDRVFEEDLLGVPTVAVRSFRGQARISNHRPLILGGLISEQDNTVKTSVPILGNIPFIGDFLGRKTKTRQRNELVIVLTPHIISEAGVDPNSTPKESLHFDTFNSVLFNDNYILKGRDLVGLDPILRTPVKGYTPDEVVDLTLLNIVKQRELVRKLRIFDEYLPEESMRLSLYKRNYPEKSVRYWSEDQRRIYYQAAAILVENIKSLNPDLDFDDIVQPRREIIIPSSPYHVSLSYEKLKPFYEKGGEVVMRDGGRELSERTVRALSELADRDLREFGEFLRSIGRTAEQHGRFRSELTRYHRTLFPDSEQFPDSEPLDDLPYDAFFARLSHDGLDFVGIATYLRYKLDSQYRSLPPKLGMLEMDLEQFSERSMSLSELADRLHELDRRWQELNESSRRPVQGL